MAEPSIGLRDEFWMSATFILKPFDEYFADVHSRFLRHAKLFLLELEIFRTELRIKFNAQGNEQVFQFKLPLEDFETEPSNIPRMKQKINQGLREINNLFPNLQADASDSVDRTMESSHENSQSMLGEF